jgi:hypothetical protein
LPAEVYQPTPARTVPPFPVIVESKAKDHAWPALTACSGSVTVAVEPYVGTRYP